MEPRAVIEEALRTSAKSVCNLDLQEIGVEHPHNTLWGDYSSNIALVNADRCGKSSPTLAEELVADLKGSPNLNIFNRIEVAGPGFINFTLSKRYFVSRMLEVLRAADSFGKANVGQNRKIALEHSNVNPNKAAHIGHLRNAVIGQFIERIYEYIGYDVNVQYYANDLGVQVCTSFLGLKKLGNELDEKKYKKFDHYMWDIYVKISNKLEEDDNLKQELDQLMARLDAREEPISHEQFVLSQRVLKDNITTFAKLDIDYDLIVYESSIKDAKMWDRAFQILQSSPNVYKAEEGRSSGCWLVKLNDKGTNKCTEVEEDKIIVRSNGIPTYTGKDIAYHMWKYGLLGTDFRYVLSNLGQQSKLLYETSKLGTLRSDFTLSDIAIDVIDVKQTYAIDAVRKSLSYSGFSKQADSLIHVNYGYVYLSDKTARKLGFIEDGDEVQYGMSGRKGLGVKIDDFLELVDRNLSVSYGSFPNARDVRNSAVKFDMLRYDTFQDVVFDLDSALDQKGFSGPYIQYTHARATSLLEKASFGLSLNSLDGLEDKLWQLEVPESAMNVVKLLYKFPEVILESARKFAPNIMCIYLYDLCQKFNSFYNDTPILKEKNSEVREFKLLLTASAKQVIKNGLYLLGIHAVDKM